MTRRIDFHIVTEEALQLAAEAILAGRLVAFPTETVYGLGANALNTEAVERIFRAKGRPATNPLIVHVAEESQVHRVVSVWPEAARLLAAKFWPGPLSIVVPKHPGLPDAVTAGGPNVAVRCPGPVETRAIIAAAGVPIAAPSANPSGELSPTTADHVIRGLGEHVDLVLDSGPCTGGLESTVIDLSTETPRLLRPGLIPLADLVAVLGPIEVVQSWESGQTPLAAPGMLAKHYAPRTALEVAETESEWSSMIHLYQVAGLKVYQLRFTGTPAEVSARLYAELHIADSAEHDRIIALLPPNTPEWAAIRDRLLRAATVD
ncbi:MAG: L-threonylcarbamoyladenylate synthase [Fimbriiglobus sp.]